MMRITLNTHLLDLERKALVLGLLSLITSIAFMIILVDRQME